LLNLNRMLFPHVGVSCWCQKVITHLTMFYAVVYGLHMGESSESIQQPTHMEADMYSSLSKVRGCGQASRHINCSRTSNLLVRTHRAKQAQDKWTCQGLLLSLSYLEQLMLGPEKSAQASMLCGLVWEWLGQPRVTSKDTAVC
jgi:hypothetical protein